MEKAPRACPSLLAALDWFTHPALVRTSAEQLQQIKDIPLLTAMLKIDPNLPARGIGMVREGLLCCKPATDEAMMHEQIERSQRRIAG